MTRMIRHTEYALAQRCADAYASDWFIPYINASDTLCVICDPGFPTCTGFMFVDNFWVEFDPAGIVNADNNDDD